MSQVSPMDGDGHRRRLKEYLLGSAPPDEQENLECRLLTEGALIEQLEMAEEELIDEYLCDELSPDERARFETHFLQAPERHERLRFARAFNRYLKTQPRGTSKTSPLPAPWGANPRTRPRAAAYAMAAMLLITGGLAIWLMGKTSRLRQELSDAQASRSSELPSDVRQIREQRNSLALEVARLAEDAQRASAPAAIHPVSLVAGRLRGPGSEEAAPIELSRNAIAIRATLSLGKDADDHYEAKLQTISGRELLSWEKLHASAGGEEQTIVLDLPVVLLASGDYQVELKGLSPAGKVETQRYFHFRVRKG